MVSVPMDNNRRMSYCAGDTSEEKGDSALHIQRVLRVLLNVMGVDSII